jgi:3-dehydroquinate synthase
MNPALTPSTAGFQTLNVALAQRSYPIYIGTALPQLGTLVCLQAASSIVLVSNPTVLALYGAQVQTWLRTHGKSVFTVVLPDGEAYKTATQLDAIYSAMLHNHCDRRAVIVALGGGVIGDVAGYAAATYMRGIAFVQVPTTLLAQVDSSVGGKTAVNHPLGKNMVGAFYQPQAVLADAGVLQTLPAREIAAGLAEVIKYGCIMDVVFFDWLVANMPALTARQPETIATAVQRSCSIKASVVAQDEFEDAAKGVRALLNFGHTFGHAFETVLGYGTWLHGEAVGYGMVCAAQLSCELNLLAQSDVERIRQLVAAAQLPTQWPNGVSADAALAAMKNDKKTDAGTLRFIVLSGLGKSSVHAVDEAMVRRVMVKLQAAK